MGIIRAASDSFGGTFADQWKDIFTAGQFDEHTVVSPGILKQDGKRGSNNKGTPGVITNGSKIFVPENTAAFIFSQSGIEDIITTPGGFEYNNGEAGVFSGDGIGKSIFGQAGKRFTYGGTTDTFKQIAFVNLREIRGIKFGTRGAQIYHDLFYNCDLEIYAYGTFTLKVTEPVRFIRNFVPANTNYYTFDDAKARSQLVSDFLQSFIVALNKLSSRYRISQLPAQANEIAMQISQDSYNAGTWEERFGLRLIHVSIENIEPSETSKEQINLFNKNRMSVSAYENVSQRASDISAQQKISSGIQENGLGDGGGMIFGMNMAQAMGTNANTSSAPKMSFDEQIEYLKKLKELLDAGILTEDEFNTKKKEIMGL